MYVGGEYRKITAREFLLFIGGTLLGGKITPSQAFFCFLIIIELLFSNYANRRTDSIARVRRHYTKPKLPECPLRRERFSVCFCVVV